MTVSKQDQLRILRWVLLCILVILVLFFIRYPVLSQECRAETPTEQLVEKASDMTQCQTRDHRFTFQWADWQKETEGFISPTLLLRNDETKAATFTVYFAFFNEEDYTYDRYEGLNYEQVRDELPWEAAEMYSEKSSFELKGGETKSVVIFTEKQDPGATYWAYADIEVPDYYECTTERVYRNVTENITTLQRGQRFLYNTRWVSLPELFSLLF